MGYSAKIIQRKDTLRKNGTASLYLQYIINRRRGKLTLNIAVRPDEFDAANQRVLIEDKKLRDDYNLILGQALGKANDIFVNYRLAEKQLNHNDFKREFENPFPAK